jgi:hypothetical protein
MDNQIVTLNAGVQMWELDKSIDDCSANKRQVRQAETFARLPRFLY